MSPQKKAILQIKHSGTTDGINVRTLAVLRRKKHIDENGKLTKRGESFAAGRLGGNIGGREDLQFGKRRLSPAKKAPKRKRITKAQERASDGLRRADFLKTERITKAALLRVLGPTGMANAVKVAPADGSTVKQADVDSFLRGGWKVEAAGTAPAKVGGPLAGQRGDDWAFTNPDPLGPKGESRAVVIIGRINADLVDQLRASGWDVSAAPKRFREATKNPSPGVMKHGEHASAAQRKAAAASRKKAVSWFRRKDLVDEPQTFSWEPPVSFIDIGHIEAIEYTSNKFDDKTRLYRHEVTKKRRLLLSTDGSCLLIFPPFRVTTRGIEG